MTKLIKTTPQFDARPAAERALHWHKLASSNNSALDLMQNERNAWRDKCAALKTALDGKVKALSAQGTCLTNAVMDFNRKTEGHTREVAQLSARIIAQEKAREVVAVEKLAKGA